MSRLSTYVAPIKYFGILNLNKDSISGDTFHELDVGLESESPGCLEILVLSHDGPLY